MVNCNRTNAHTDPQTNIATTRIQSMWFRVLGDKITHRRTLQIIGLIGVEADSMKINFQKLKFVHIWSLKSRIRETPILSTDADSSTDTIQICVGYLLFI